MGAPGRPTNRNRLGSDLIKRIGGDGTLQLGPDVGRITRRRGGNYDAG